MPDFLFYVEEIFKLIMEVKRSEGSFNALLLAQFLGL